MEQEAAARSVRCYKELHVAAVSLSCSSSYTQRPQQTWKWDKTANLLYEAISHLKKTSEHAQLSLHQRDRKQKQKEKKSHRVYKICSKGSICAEIRTTMEL